MDIFISSQKSADENLDKCFDSNVRNMSEKLNGNR
jgi:hypothetical protein